MQVRWSRKLAAPPRGLALARERGWLLVWDSEHNLHLFNRSGDVQARWQAADALADACCADDGGGFAAVGAGGQVWMLAPDLTPRWERLLPQSGTAVALDPFGQYLAAADGRGGLTLFDRTGRTRWNAANARPLQHLAFIPSAPPWRRRPTSAWSLVTAWRGTSCGATHRWFTPAPWRSAATAR